VTGSVPPGKWRSGQPCPARAGHSEHHTGADRLRPTDLVVPAAQLSWLGRTCL
jgi:hypothetical protein